LLKFIFENVCFLKWCEIAQNIQTMTSQETMTNSYTKTKQTELVLKF